MNNTQVDNAKDIVLVVPMYNLIECSDNYFKTPGSLWQYHRDYYHRNYHYYCYYNSNNNINNNDDNNDINSAGANHNCKLFIYKQKITD